MAASIVIVDYHKGNLRSVERGLVEAGGTALVSDDPSVIAAADALVLPGVGSFGDAAAYLRDMIEVGRATPAAASIACPTLVIGASSGTYTNAEAMQRWVEKLPLGQVANVQCVHWPLTECPADVSRVIEKWIAGRFDQARCA